jgi:hypothetical protein
MVSSISTFSEDIPTLVKDGKGGIRVNPDKGAQKFFWLRAVGPNNVFPFVLPSLQSNILNLIVPAEENLRGDFEICNLHSTSTGRFTAELLQATVNRNLQNAPVCNNLLFGNINLPNEMMESLYVQPTTTVQIRITDLSGAPNTIAIVGMGRRFLDWGNERIGEMRRRAFYSQRTHTYWLTPNTGPVVPLGAGASATILYTVPSAADFEMKYILDDSDGAYTVQFFEGLSSRSLMDAAISARDFVAGPTFAVGGFPSGGLVRASGMPGRICDWSHLLKRSAQFMAVVTDTSGAPNNIRLGFGGRLVYYDAPKGEYLTVPEEKQNAGSRRASPLLGYGNPGWGR